MKVRVAYTIDVSNDMRRAINQYHGQPGLASREEVKDWFYLHGQSMNDDILHDMNDGE